MRIDGALGTIVIALAIACSEPPAPPKPKKPPPARELGSPIGSPIAKGAQPKPGERVRQPLLDDHCAEMTSRVAFYYHGGRPFAQRALGDGCRPLYMTECEESGECSQSSEQEQGMWCCSDPSGATVQHAERR